VVTKRTGFAFEFRRHDGEKLGQTSFEQSMALSSFEVGVVAAIGDSSPAVAGTHCTALVTRRNVIAIAVFIFVALYLIYLF
jgi:hypothetical protein